MENLNESPFSQPNMKCYRSKEVPFPIKKNRFAVAQPRKSFSSNKSFHSYYCQKEDTNDSKSFESFFIDLWKQYPDQVQPDLYFTASDEEKMTHNLLELSDSDSDSDEYIADLNNFLRKEALKCSKMAGKPSWTDTVPGYSPFEFPNRKSILSRSEMNECYEIACQIFNKKSLSSDQHQKYLTYKTRLEAEQKQYLKLAYELWLRSSFNRHKEIPSSVEQLINLLWQDKLFAVHGYPKYYLQKLLLPMCPKSPDPVEMNFVKSVCSLGSTPRLFFPNLCYTKINTNSSIIPLQEQINEKKKSRQVLTKSGFHLNISEDQIVEKAVMENDIQVVMSAGVFSVLADNHPPPARINQWTIPFTIKEYQQSLGSKKKTVIYFDKPLPPKSMNQYQRKEKYYKISANFLLGTPNAGSKWALNKNVVDANRTFQIKTEYPNEMDSKRDIPIPLCSVKQEKELCDLETSGGVKCDIYGASESQDNSQMSSKDDSDTNCSHVSNCTSDEESLVIDLDPQKLIGKSESIVEPSVHNISESNFWSDSETDCDYSFKDCDTRNNNDNAYSNSKLSYFSIDDAENNLDICDGIDNVLKNVLTEKDNNLLPLQDIQLDVDENDKVLVNQCADCDIFGGVHILSNDMRDLNLESNVGIKEECKSSNEEIYDECVLFVPTRNDEIIDVDTRESNLNTALVDQYVQKNQYFSDYNIMVNTVLKHKIPDLYWKINSHNITRCENIKIESDPLDDTSSSHGLESTVNYCNEDVVPLKTRNSLPVLLKDSKENIQPVNNPLIFNISADKKSECRNDFSCDTEGLEVVAKSNLESNFKMSLEEPVLDESYNDTNLDICIKSEPESENIPQIPFKPSTSPVKASGSVLKSLLEGSPSTSSDIDESHLLNTQASCWSYKGEFGKGPISENREQANLSKTKIAYKDGSSQSPFKKLLQWDNSCETAKLENIDYSDLLSNYISAKSNLKKKNFPKPKGYLDDNIHYNENSKHRHSMDSPSAVLAESFSYDIWKLHKSTSSILSKNFSKDINILIRSKRGHKKKNNMVKISVKSEYQSEIGGETMSLSQLTREWASIAIRRDTSLLRVRLDGVSGEMIKLQELTASEIAAEARRDYNIGSLGGQCLGSIQILLENLLNLSPGFYLLSRSISNPTFATVYTNVGMSMNYDYSLHLDYPYDGTPVAPEHPSWVPLDTFFITPKFERMKRVPATFIPPIRMNLARKISTLKSLGLDADGNVIPRKNKKKKNKKLRTEAGKKIKPRSKRKPKSSQTSDMQNTTVE